jgi:hypothetical protein
VYFFSRHWYAYFSLPHENGNRYADLLHRMLHLAAHPLLGRSSSATYIDAYMTDVSCHTLQPDITLHDLGRTVEHENDPVNKSLYSSSPSVRHRSLVSRRRRILYGHMMPSPWSLDLRRLVKTSRG